MSCVHPLWAAALALALTPPALAAADPVATRAENAALLAQEAAQQNYYRVWFPDLATGRRAAISLHGQLMESNWDSGHLIAQLDPDDINRLQGFGLRIDRAEDFIARHRHFIEALQAAGMPPLLGRAAAARAAQPGAQAEAIPGYPCYETVEETYAAAQGFTTRYPTLATWTPVGQSWEQSAGLGGYPLQVLKLTNQATTGPNGDAKPRLFIHAAMHAREYATAPLVLAFARQLLTGYGVDADATWLLDHHEIHLLLQTNPDGRKKAELGLSWRKNTNQAYCGANSNSRGADLNRNFSFSWNSTNGQGSSGNPCAETFRGPGASSEPETQAVEAYVRSLWPDRRGPGRKDAAPADTSGIHLDIHSFGQLLLWPWGDTSQTAPNGKALQTLGRKFAYFNGHTPEQSYGLYPTDGTSDGVSYGELGVPAFTFELGTTFFQSCASYEATIKPNNLNALMYAAKVVRTPYLSAAGPDATELKLSRQAASQGVPRGTKVKLRAVVTDSRYNNSNGTEPTQAIASAEAFIDVPPWLPGAVALPLAPADGVFDSPTEAVVARLKTKQLSPGKHLVFVRGRDAAGNDGPVTASFLVIN
jgi:carboxypeptidase T